MGPRRGLHGLENTKLCFTAGIRTPYRPAHNMGSVPGDLYRMCTSVPGDLYRMYRSVPGDLYRMYTSVPSDLYRMYTSDTTTVENVKLCMFMCTVAEIRFHTRHVGW